MPPKTRLLLVDDHSLFRESLGRLLEVEAGLELSATAASIPEALKILEMKPIDLVLLDIDLGDEQGIELLESARAGGYAGKVLIVTAGMADADALRAIRAGASGIFLKHSPPSELITAIYRVMGGDTWLDPGAARALVTASVGTEEEKTSSAALSPREQGVLSAVFEGLTNKEIAVRLGISEGYVKAVLQQLFAKTGVRSRSQLVRIALENRERYGLGRGRW